MLKKSVFKYFSALISKIILIVDSIKSMGFSGSDLIQAISNIEQLER